MTPHPARIPDFRSLLSMQGQVHIVLGAACTLTWRPVAQ
jgi:hypothetical protein